MTTVTGMITYFLFFIASMLIVMFKSKNTYLLILLRIIAYLLPLMGILYGLYDELSLIFLGVSLPVSMLVSLYNLWYSQAKYKEGNLRELIDIFGLSINYSFAAPNLVSLISIWTISEITGFLLVCYEGGDEALRAGYRFFFLKGMTFELSALTVLIVLAHRIGLINALIMSFNEIPSINVDLLLSVLIIIGFITTSAIVPLHFWLPHAHSIAPGTASALLSGLTVKMGFYGLLRIAGFIVFPDNLWYGVLILSGITTIYGFTVLLTQHDIKRMLAYSTMGNTGLIGVLLSINMLHPSPLIFYSVIVNIYAHALYKSMLFINTGTIIVLAKTRILNELSSLAAFTPYSSLGILFTVLSIFGVPPTVGFLGKLLAIIALLGVNNTYLAIIGLALVAYSILISIVYGFTILSVHWKYAGIRFKPVEIPLYPQFIELLLGLLGIIYGLLVLLFFNLGALGVLLLVNLFSLFIIVALISIFYYNIRARIIQSLGEELASPRY